eukprot:gb/GECG01009221.1/.p1 GENE.gb/GECG01009221.1/~~gb/GECG01009221.1/.p1  ORF type:complete len:637 (+),score=53.48 gb/GECG01009221.1/:1-1911(+)
MNRGVDDITGSSALSSSLLSEEERFSGGDEQSDGNGDGRADLFAPEERNGQVNVSNSCPPTSPLRKSQRDLSGFNKVPPNGTHHSGATKDVEGAHFEGQPPKKYSQFALSSLHAKDGRKRRGRAQQRGSFGSDSQHSRHSALEKPHGGFEPRSPYRIDSLKSFNAFFYPILLLLCAVFLIILGVAFLVRGENTISKGFGLTRCAVNRQTRDLIGACVLCAGVLFPFVWVRFLSWVKSPRRIDAQRSIFNSDALLDVKLSAQAAFEHYDALGQHNVSNGTIVMIAGASAPRRILLPMAVRLAVEYRVILIDVPGQGSLHSVPFSLSRASRVICHILDREIGFGECMRRVFLVGWGASGYTAAYLCANDPYRVAGLAILGPVPNYVSPPPCTAAGFEKSYRLRWICAWGNWLLKNRIAIPLQREAHKRALQLQREDLVHTKSKRQMGGGIALPNNQWNHDKVKPNDGSNDTSSSKEQGDYGKNSSSPVDNRSDRLSERRRSVEPSLQPVGEHDEFSSQGDIYEIDDFNLNTIPSVIHSIRRRNLLAQLRTFRRPMLIIGPQKWGEEAQSLIPTSLLSVEIMEALDSPLMPPQSNKHCEQVAEELQKFARSLELPAVMTAVEQREVRKASMSSFHSLTG